MITTKDDVLKVLRINQTRVSYFGSPLMQGFAIKYIIICVNVNFKYVL